MQHIFIKRLQRREGMSVVCPAIAFMVLVYERERERCANTHQHQHHLCLTDDTKRAQTTHGFAKHTFENGIINILELYIYFSIL